MLSGNLQYIIANTRSATQNKQASMPHILDFVFNIYGGMDHVDHLIWGLLCIGDFRPNTQVPQY